MCGWGARVSCVGRRSGRYREAGDGGGGAKYGITGDDDVDGSQGDVEKEPWPRAEGTMWWRQRWFAGLYRSRIVVIMSGRCVRTPTRTQVAGEERKVPVTTNHFLHAASACR